MSETITCPTCGRALDREKTADGYRIMLKGKPPLPCCQRAATDGHTVVGQFVTDPGV